MLRDRRIDQDRKYLHSVRLIIEIQVKDRSDANKLDELQSYKDYNEKKSIQRSVRYNKAFKMNK